MKHSTLFSAGENSDNFQSKENAQNAQHYGMSINKVYNRIENDDIISSPPRKCC